MNKIISALAIILVSLTIFGQSPDHIFLTRKYQGIAIGQLTLAHRLISLSTSFAISKAVDGEYILSLLQNIDATIENSKSIIISNDNNPDNLTVEILKAIDFFVNCSNHVKIYTKDQSYNNLSSVRSCIENSSNIIDNLTDSFNALESRDPEKKKQKEKTGKTIDKKQKTN